MDSMRSGVVLAGGRSRRFGRGDKCLAEVSGRPMVEVVVETLASSLAEVVVVAGGEAQAAGLASLGAEVAVDRVEGFGPVAGLQAGFSAASGGSCFVTGCDTPLIRREVAELLFDQCTGFEGAVPSDDRLEPLTAVYRREPMLEAANAALKRGDTRIVDLYGDLGPVRLVPMERIREVDPELDSFFNVNTVEDLEAAEEKMASRGGPDGA